MALWGGVVIAVQELMLVVQALHEGVLVVYHCRLVVGHDSRLVGSASATIGIRMHSANHCAEWVNRRASAIVVVLRRAQHGSQTSRHTSYRLDLLLPLLLRRELLELVDLLRVTHLLVPELVDLPLQLDHLALVVDLHAMAVLPLPLEHLLVVLGTLALVLYLAVHVCVRL